MGTDEALAYLAALSPSTIRLGLERVTAALATLGHPERAYPSVHVAGTNGKGSTCAMIAACLGQRHRVGFYSSPHLVRVNERFKVDGLDIDDETLALRIGELRERLGEHALTYFEFGTVLAFWHFKQAGVQLAVIETGLGGRLDATVVCAPLVTAITSISFDHMELLGATLPLIAGEKAGIVKAGVPLVVARQPPEVLEVFTAAAARAGSALIVEGRDVEFSQGRYRGTGRVVEGLALPLAGAHQAINAGVALGCLEVLGARGFPLTDDELRAGLARTTWPGRLQIVEGAPTILLDGAHNVGGVAALGPALDERFQGRPVRLVFGVFADKEIEPMLAALLPRVSAAHVCALHSARTSDPHALAELARRELDEVHVHASVAEALESAIAAAAPGEVVVVAGSLHLVGEALAWLRARFEALLGALADFVPGEDPVHTMEALGALAARGFPSLDPARFRDAVFALLERFPEAEFGTPGPLIHEIERRGGFEAALSASVARQPTFLTVSMVNRVMNLTEDASRLARWVAVLEQASGHPRAPDWVRTAARRYLEHQRAR